MPDAAQPIEGDLVVVGAGGAGLFTALTAAHTGARVILISASPLAQTASYWAQGGLAAALGPDDTPDLHREDTEIAGRGLVRVSAAVQLCREAPGIVHELEALGVRFDSDQHGELALGLEGGHSRRRVVHAGGSATGRRVVRTLSALVVEQPRVTVIEQARASVLWTDGGRVIGVVCSDGRAVKARATVLATGGMAALWSRTTNPPGSQGQGLLLARHAGADLADLEFMQFHPTAVTGVPGREGFLVTEAIRGEGATLHDLSGERFVDELLPRDEVSAAIWSVMQRTGSSHVLLDMRSIDHSVFPNVVGALRDSGLDPATTMVPVAPAAHYGMGGVKADLDGASTVPGLYVVGETACTGLHGANRLASNSLLEGLVYAERIAADIARERADGGLAARVPRPVAHPERPAHPLLPAEARFTIQRIMTEGAGVLRSAASLATAADRLERLHTEACEALEGNGKIPEPGVDTWETTNLLCVARVLVAAARLRRETRGCHWREDHPGRDDAHWRRHIVVRLNPDHTPALSTTDGTDFPPTRPGAPAPSRPQEQ